MTGVILAGHPVAPDALPRLTDPRRTRLFIRSIPHGFSLPAFAGGRAHRYRHHRRRGNGRCPADDLVRRMVGAARRGTDDTDTTASAARLTFGVRTSSAATAPRPANTLERLHHWNHVAIDSSGLDHSPVGVGAPHTFGHQLGPGRSSRALAIVHIAVFEVVNAIDRRYESYLGVPAVGSTASMDAAIAQAAHDTLVALFPSQRAQFDQLLAADLATSRTARPRGTACRSAVPCRGHPAEMRNDGSNHAEPLIGVDYIPATSRACGARIRSAGFRSRWARAGARCGRSSCSRAATSARRPRRRCGARPTPPPSTR